MARPKLTNQRIRATRARAIEAQREAAACYQAARRLLAEPKLDPDFPASALMLQGVAAAAAERAMRDLNRLVRRT